MDNNHASKTVSIVMHHIAALKSRQLDEVMCDYTEDSVVISIDRIFKGRAEIRANWQAAISATPPEFESAVTLIRQDILDEVAFVIWKAEPLVKLASDTYVMRGGKINIHTYIRVLY